MAYRNYTPHAIILMNGAERIVFGSEGVARVTVTQTRREGHPYRMMENSYGRVEGLPPRNGEDWFIVSSLVLSAAKAEGRDDCIAPDTGKDAERDQDGRITAVRGFVC